VIAAIAPAVVFIVVVIAGVVLDLDCLREGRAKW
jgi:hypothetical protein